MNIIFLDIDGVLNCQLHYEKRKAEGRLNAKDHPYSEICQERVSWLNGLCESVDAKVVISSTWRHSGIDYCKDVLTKCGATFDIIDITPSIRFKGSVRGNEIKAWIEDNYVLLNKHSHEFHTYAIIDDDSDMLLWQREHFFQTDSYSGLTPNTCHRIELFFKRQNAFALTGQELELKEKS